MAKRIIIAGGGTGGHIFPAIAVANALRAIEPDIEILFVGAKGKMEMEKVPKAGFKVIGLEISGLDRGQWWKNLSLPYKLLKSFWQVRSIFSNFKPDAAFGVGGYSSYPVLRFAQTKGIPTYLHEANAYGGKSNMLLAKRAKIVFTGTKGMEKFFPSGKTFFSGNPVRKEVIKGTRTPSEALASFGLEPHKTTLLVVGGSLGARTINHAVRAGVNRWVEAGHQLIWQTGQHYFQEAKAAADSLKGVLVSDFVWDMNGAYTAADLVISRAGAMSVTELCLTGKPVIFVPFPYAAEDHQTANAMALVNKNAAWLVKDDKAGSELINKALELAGNTALRNEMSRNISTLATSDADKLIAEKILKDLKG